jgi:cytochrome c peroxidase
MYKSSTKYMRMRTLRFFTTALALASFVYSGCNENEVDTTEKSYPAVEREFAGQIDLHSLDKYAGQGKPSYITKDNTGSNVIKDPTATLGRVLFYDKRLSKDNTIACASCHQQQFAFGDTAVVSKGVAGVTGRHSMRLVNTRFASEVKFFWDERATSLEDQTTRPIQDHAEMGFSGKDGDPSLADLINKLEATDYYQELFEFVYGDATITEARLQECLSQFIRSIQSFDSKYDVGRASVTADNQNFPNFTAEENLGKALFLAPPPAGGAGCAGCHRAPEFDIDPLSRNNGVIGVANNAGAQDLTNTRAPSLRDLIGADGKLNGPLMHNGAFHSLLDVVNHYNKITIGGNTNLDPRLLGGPGGTGEDLQLTNSEKQALVVFLGTLTGSAIYTDKKWSNPFVE